MDTENRFECMCDYHNVQPDEKEAVKQILKMLNGRTNRNAIDILDFTKMVIENISTVSVDFE